MDESHPHYRYQPKHPSDASTAAPAPPPIPRQAPPPPPMPIPMPPPRQITPHYGPPIVTTDDRTMAMLCHLLSILTGFLGPLILWLIKKDNSPFVDHHGREAINFQITIFLVMLVASSATVALMFLIVGFFLFPLLIVIPILAIVAEILACVAANNGQWHRYPCCLRIL